MYTPIIWILEDINDSLRSKEVKEKIKKGEPISLDEDYPLMTRLIKILLMVLVLCLAREILQDI